MIEVTLRFNSVEAMLAHFMPPVAVGPTTLVSPATPFAVTVIAPEPEPAAPPKRAARKKAKVASSAAKVTEALNAAVPSATSNEPPIVSVEDVEKALDRLFDAKGIEVTRGVMARFGVKRGRELKPEQYEGFVKKCD